MELEHLMQYSPALMALQLLFAGSLLGPAAAGRMDLYRRFVGSTASMVVTFGPVGLLLFVLYEVARLS